MPKTKSKSGKVDRRRIKAGWSIPGAAEEVGVPYKTMRGAIERGHVRTITFGGLDWVPNSEGNFCRVARWRATAASERADGDT